jgi:hypothetical protein
MHAYDFCPANDGRHVDLVSNALPLGVEPNAWDTRPDTRDTAAGTMTPVIRVDNEAGNLIGTHECTREISREV